MPEGFVLTPAQKRLLSDLPSLNVVGQFADGRLIVEDTLRNGRKFFITTGGYVNDYDPKPKENGASDMET